MREFHAWDSPVPEVVALSPPSPLRSELIAAFNVLIGRIERLEGALTEADGWRALFEAEATERKRLEVELANTPRHFPFLLTPLSTPYELTCGVEMVRAGAAGAERCLRSPGHKGAHRTYPDA